MAIGNRAWRLAIAIVKLDVNRVPVHRDIRLYNFEMPAFGGGGAIYSPVRLLRLLHNVTPWWHKISLHIVCILC